MQRSKRLKVIYSDYVYDPIGTVSTYIGPGATILNMKQNSVIMSGYIIVDVEYKVIDIDLNKIYWTNKTDYKLNTSNNNNKYVTSVDGIPLYVLINKSNQDMVKIPIIIKPIISNTIVSPEPIKYYGTIVSSPFHCYSNTMNSVNQKCDIDLDTLEVSKSLFSKEDIMRSYENFNNLITNNYSKYITGFLEIKDVKDIVATHHKGYIIDGRKLSAENLPNGTIVCAEKRSSPFEVMFIPISSFDITQRDIDNLRSFMYKEYENYNEWVKNT